jgi:ferredoxin
MRLTRWSLQFGFLALVLIGVFLVRGHAEGWCPFGGVESLYTYAREGALPCSLGLSNFYILGALLVVTLLVRRVFCGYVCPIGTISEWLRRGARRLGLRDVKVPYKLDRGLALLKYGLLAVILVFTYRTGELIFRGLDPCYALIGRHGDDVTVWAYVVSGAIVLGSLFVMLPFCRWLCPLAAAFDPFSRFGLARIKRDARTCTGCGRCADACPTAIPVDREREVRAARCFACMECVAACPAGAKGALTWGPPGPAGRRWPYGVLIAILIGGIGLAVAATYGFPAPSFTHERGEKPAVTSRLDLTVTELTCRGRANLFIYFLDRGDLFAVPGYVKAELWPAPGRGRARIHFDPARTSADAIRSAITEPFFDAAIAQWQSSPFAIEGYDLLQQTRPRAERR